MIRKLIMRLNKINKKPQLFLFILNILFCLFLYLNNSNLYKKNTYTVPAVNGDSHQYLNISVNIFKNQTFSHDSPTMESVHPAYYREFYYPLYLSAFYFFLDWKNYDYSICTVPNKTKIQNCEKFYKLILISQILLVFLCFSNLIILFKKKILISLLSAGIIFFILIEKNTIYYIGPEFLSAIIFFNFCLFLIKTINSKKIKYLFVSIFFMTSLILIKNVFYYLPFLGLITSTFLIIFYAAKNYFFTGSININYSNNFKIFIISVASLILVLPYQLRNVIYFDDSSLSKRSHEALFMRNEFLNASYKQLSTGFYYYSPNFFGYKNDKFTNIQKNSFFYEQNPKSYYRNYTKKNGYSVSYINSKFGTNYNSFDELERYKRDVLIKTNVEIYLKNLVKQSYISTLIFFRGINENYNIAHNNHLRNFIFDLINYFLTFYFLYNFFLSIKNKDYENFIFMFPCFYFIFMMSTLTQTEPRMNNTILIFLLYYFILNKFNRNFSKSLSNH